jgi:aminomethyltransferase
MKKTPLYNQHVQLDAKMVDFGGFNMPIQYRGISIEHQCVRNDVGIFDVSHMGEFFVQGNESTSFLNFICSNDINKIEIQKAQYNCFVNNHGGIVDDLIVYRIEEKKYMLVVNAANIEKDWKWIKKNIQNFDCKIINSSADIGLISVQGPESLNLINDTFSKNFSNLKKFSFNNILVSNKTIIVSNTGYTGSKGYELYIDASIISSIWNKLIEEGKKYKLQPIGLGARDTLRMEMGYCLYGNDIDDITTPYEANLMWVTDIKKDFIGKEKVLKSMELSSKRMINFKMIERGIPRNGYEICNIKGDKIGYVTSGTFSPSNKVGIGIGYLKIEYSMGDEIFILIRDKLVKAEIIKLPIQNG